MTLDQAKMSLIRNSNVLSAALDAGLSGPSRLHDLSVTFEAMTPGQMKARGKGLTIKYGASPSPLGLCIVCATEKGVCGLAFAWPEDKDKTINKMIGRWPHAAFKQDDDLAFKVTRMIFNDKTHPIALHAMGTNFQVQVWKALLSIPFGQTATYKIIAENVCTAKASRAVGAANAANPISLLIPCHRVIRESEPSRVMPGAKIASALCWPGSQREPPKRRHFTTQSNERRTVSIRFDIVIFSR